VERALENTALEVIVYQGQLDIICDVVGTVLAMMMMMMTMAIEPIISSQSCLYCFSPRNACQA